ncbi:MAG: VWA domain-containing protein, partial [Planctomycetes bacterium]|nr:VWA domain-containing protein [Planctomycetota bacterium]
MRIAYLEFDREEALRRLSVKQLMQIWNQLLLQASGDVDQALEWLEYLFERYNLERMGQGFEEFKERLLNERFIEPEGSGEVPRHKLTGKGERAIRQDSLDQIFQNLKSVGSGNHRTPREGSGGDNLSETRPFQAGDLSSDIDYQKSIKNAFQRAGINKFSLAEDDLEVFEKEHYASCATVLMIDISHSMILYGEDRITPAKRTAIALAELIQTKYPKDSLEVITFGNEAQKVRVRDLPYLQVGPFHTNTKAGLQLAQRLLAKKRQTNKQIFMITDG